MRAACLESFLDTCKLTIRTIISKFLPSYYSAIEILFLIFHDVIGLKFEERLCNVSH